MFHNQVQQVQQKLNTVQQVVAQVRQSEQQNQQRLQQLAQEEANAVQQLQRAQQICQECVSSLQSISYTQPSYTQGIQTQTYQPQNYGQTTSPISQGNFTTSGLFDPTTMEPSTYQQTLQTFGASPTFASTQNPATLQSTVFSSTSPQQNWQTTTGANLSNIATMDPDTYLASRQRLSNNQQLGQQYAQQQYGQQTSQQIGQQIGQQAGITASSMTSPISSMAGSISQQSDIMNTNRNFNQ